jgi:hypothetical protein
VGEFALAGQLAFKDGFVASYAVHPASLHSLINPALILSIVAFAWYGLACWISDRMVTEFARYRLSGWRRTTGTLQMLGSAGLAIGYVYLPVRVLAASGLALMMLAGLIVRWRIRDPLHAMIPAFSLGLINLFIALTAWPTASDIK